MLYYLILCYIIYITSLLLFFKFFLISNQLLMMSLVDIYLKSIPSLICINFLFYSLVVPVFEHLEYLGSYFDLNFHFIIVSSFLMFIKNIKLFLYTFILINIPNIIISLILYFPMRKNFLLGFGLGDILVLSSICVYFNYRYLLLILLISIYTALCYCAINQICQSYIQILIFSYNNYLLFYTNFIIPFIPFIFIGYCFTSLFYYLNNFIIS
jgi:hypothetical protein